jgi:D-alanyl-D-alanine-carboxypeptidase/D-alanyl-D-alanine-endopeptidase
MGEVLRGRAAAAKVAGVASLLLALAACASKPPPPPPRPPAVDLDGSLTALYAQSGAQGMVVTVVQGDEVTVRGFGRVHAASPSPPDGATLVRLESISKLFASDLLSRLVVAGRAKLTDTLPQTPAPKRRKLKDPPGPITLVELATHTSGLPRTAPIDPTWDAAKSAAARAAWLAKTTKRDPPGVGALYSNVGFDLLGDRLTALDGRPYAEALRTRVTGPLTMADTTPSPSGPECARLLDPDPSRPPKPCIDQAGFAASGGLYSTGNDIGLWLKDQLAARPDPARLVSQAVYVQRGALKTAIGLDHAGPAEAIGLAWIEEAPTATHPRILEKTGGGDGFLTYVVIDPARRVGVFFAIDKVGHGVLTPLTQTANDLVGALGRVAR